MSESVALHGFAITGHSVNCSHSTFKTPELSSCCCGEEAALEPSTPQASSLLASEVSVLGRSDGFLVCRSAQQAAVVWLWDIKGTVTSSFEAAFPFPDR